MATSDVDMDVDLDDGGSNAGGSDALSGVDIVSMTEEQMDEILAANNEEGGHSGSSVTSSGVSEVEDEGLDESQEEAKAGVAASEDDDIVSAARKLETEAEKGVSDADQDIPETEKQSATPERESEHDADHVSPLRAVVQAVLEEEPATAQASSPADRVTTTAEPGSPVARKAKDKKVRKRVSAATQIHLSAQKLEREASRSPKASPPRETNVAIETTEVAALSGETTPRVIEEEGALAQSDEIAPPAAITPAEQEVEETEPTPPVAESSPRATRSSTRSKDREQPSSSVAMEVTEEGAASSSEDERAVVLANAGREAGIRYMPAGHGAPWGGEVAEGFLPAKKTKLLKYCWGRITKAKVACREAGSADWPLLRRGVTVRHADLPFTNWTEKNQHALIKAWVEADLRCPVAGCEPDSLLDRNLPAPRASYVSEKCPR